MIVVDTGVLYAYVDGDDDHHTGSRELLETYPGEMVVPMLCIAEAAYLIGSRHGSRVEASFIADLTSGAFIIDPVQPEDWLRIVDLVRRYRSLPLGTTDASVVACAERHRVDTVATTDRRHFVVVRPSHVDAFTLVP